MQRIAAFNLHRRQARALQNGQQVVAAPEEMTSQAIVIPDSEEQDGAVCWETHHHDEQSASEQEAGPSDEQVESESLRDLEPRNKAQAKNKMRPTPKAKHTARSQLFQKTISTKWPMSGDGQRSPEKTRPRVSQKSADKNVASRPLATQADLASCPKTATSTVGAAGPDVATGPRSEPKSRSSIPSNRPAGLSSADGWADPDHLDTKQAGRKHFDPQHATASAKTNKWRQLLPTFPISVQEKWKAISALPGLGSNKTTLKQFMQNMYWESGCDVGNELFRLVMKQQNLEMQNEDACWVSWKKFCDEEGEEEAKQMREDGTVQTRDHPRLRDGKQYKLHREWSRSTMMTDINGTLEKTFAGTPETIALFRQILQVTHDSCDVREQTSRRKHSRPIREKTASQVCADQAQEVLKAITRVLAEINAWLEVSQASKFTKDLRRQLHNVKTQISACEKVFAHISSEKQRGQFPPEDNIEGVRDRCCTAAALIKQSKTFMLLLRQNMQAEEQMTGVSFNFPGKQKRAASGAADETDSV